ncbi:hypothetical protein ABEV54_22045 [Peribacillus psychrosaccharolyticus]
MTVVFITGVGKSSTLEYFTTIIEGNHMLKYGKIIFKRRWVN